MPDWGSLHPSTRRDASPALAARREEPSLARQPAHFYAFIEVVRLSAEGIRGCLAIAKDRPRHRAAWDDDARRFTNLRLRRPRLGGIR